MEDLYFVIFILIILLGLFISFRQAYYRVFKSYKEDIDDYFAKHKYKVKSIKSPNKYDWHYSPFDKGSTYSLVTVNNSPLIHKKYKIIEVLSLDGLKSETYWIQIKNWYFHKPELQFKKDKEEESSNIDYMEGGV